MKAGDRYRKLRRRQEAFDSMPSTDKVNGHYMHRPGGKPGAAVVKGNRNRSSK